MKTGHKKIILGLIILVVLVILAYYAGFAHYLSLENIKSNAAQYKMRVNENYVGAVVSFISICTLLITFTLPITAPMGVVSGFLFGIFPGSIFSIISVLLGSGISFLIIRYALSHVVRRHYSKQLDAFNDKIKSYGYTYLISLQLLTVIPFFVINTLAALAGVSFFTFLWTTAAGAFPVSAIYAFAGRQLYTIHSWQDVLSKEMLLLLVLLAGLAMLPMLMRRISAKKEKEGGGL